MKFQNMGMKNEYCMEDRYNDFWNSQAVSSYDLLKIHAQSQINTFFSTNNPSVDHLVKKYCDAVATIVNNLTRQIDLFEDQDYVKTYLESTKQVAISDLQEIMCTFLLSKESLNCINNAFNLLQDKKAESAQIVSTQEDSLDLDMELDVQLQDIEEFFSGNYSPSGQSF